MAVTKILAKSMRVDKLINYVANADKTDEKALVSYIGCKPGSAAQQMMATKRHYQKTDGVQAYHIIQSFRPDEITPELAHELGNRFIKEYLDGYEVVLGTHIDKDHIHNHIAFNSVSDATGKKYHSSPESYYKGIRAISDALCHEYGFSVIMETGSKGLSYAEWKLHKSGLLSYRDLLDQDIKEVLSIALDVGNFYELMEDRGYTIEHHSKYPSFIPDGSKAAYRAKMDGKSLSEDDIRGLIEHSLEVNAPEVFRERQYVPFEKHGKQHGFRALYVSWMYVLGVIGKGGSSGYPKISYSEIKRFEQYKKQQSFLEENSIDTNAQLTEKMENIQDEINKLEKTRTILNSKKKRNKPLYDAMASSKYLKETPILYANGTNGIEPDYQRYLEAERFLKDKDIPSLQKERAELYEQLSEINSELRKLRSEYHLCKQIHEDIPEIINRLSDESRRDSRREHFRS